jgi:hypothetical protein
MDPDFYPEFDPEFDIEDITRQIREIQETPKRDRVKELADEVAIIEQINTWDDFED